MEKSISKNAIFNMLNKALAVVFPLITVTYISRIMGASGIGEVSSAQNYVTYFTMCASLGIPSYGVRAIAQARTNKQQCDKVFSELFCINAISTIAVLTLYYVSISIFHVKNIPIELSLIFSSLIIFNLFNVEWVYQGFEEYKYITMRNLLVKIVSIVLMFIFVRSRKDVIGYSIVLCFGTIGSYLFNMTNISRYISFIKKDLHLGQHMKPIFVFFASVLAIELYSLLDITMLNIGTTSTNVGYYANSTKIIKTIANTLTGFAAVLMPRLSLYFHNEDTDKIKLVCSKFLDFSLFFSIPAFLGIEALADQIVLVLFGDGFLPAIITIRLLGILIISMPLTGGVFCQLLLTSGREKQYLMCVLVGTIVNAIFNTLLIPKFFQNGAAFASALSELSVCICMIVCSEKIIKVRIPQRDFISIIMAGLLMFGSVILIKSVLSSIPGIIALGVEVCVGVAVYFAVGMLTKNSMIELVFSKIHKKRNSI